MKHRIRLLPALMFGSICQQSWALAVLADGAQDALLEVTVNGDKQQAWSLVKLNGDGSPWAKASDLQSWGIPLAALSGSVPPEPEAFVSLNELPGVHATVDRADSELIVDVQPALLHAHEIHLDRVSPRPTASPPAVFFNYQIGAERQADIDQLRAATELGWSYANWVASSAWYETAGDGPRDSLRLNSTLTADYPAAQSTLQLGDTYATLGTSAAAVRIAGVSWGTNFSITPNFISFPLPTVSNVAATLDAVEVYVNGVKTQNLTVPGGPFTISDLPVSTGAGEVTVVTHDLQGHAQSFTQSYYVSPQMLQAGLMAWDFQLGAKRLDYGTDSNDYAGWVASGGERYGISDKLTAQWHIDADDTGAALGAQWLAVAPNDALLTLSPGCSAVAGAVGCLVAAGYERQLTVLSYGTEAQVATPHYTPVAAALLPTTPRWQVYSHIQGGGVFGTSLSLGGTWCEAASDAHTLNLNLTASKTWIGAGHIDLVFNRTLGGSAASSYVALIYTYRIDNHHSASASTFSNNGQAGAEATLQRNAPAGDGFGYLVRAGEDGSVEGFASAQWNGDKSSLSGIAEREGTASSVSGQVSGAVLWFGDDVFVTRRLDRSFAVVHAENLADIPVYLDNQPVTHTDRAGLAVLPGLRPFEANGVDLDLTTVPASLDTPQTHFDAIPYRRGGVFVEVPVRLGASIKLMLETGKPVPAGARILGAKGGAPVGNDGNAYIEGVAGNNALQVTWAGGQCHSVLRLPVTSRTDALDDVVRLACVATH
jgi:outer membrane usher protein